MTLRIPQFDPLLHLGVTRVYERVFEGKRGWVRGWVGRGERKVCKRRYERRYVVYERGE